MVSMKVTWVEIVAETMGTKVSYLTFLSSVSGIFPNQYGGIILRCALGQNDTELYEFVCDTLMLLGALEEGDIQDVAIG